MQINLLIGILYLTLQSGIVFDSTGRIQLPGYPVR
jgi:hypothetical protein